MITITDVSRDVAQARRLHAFLMPHFGPEELEPLSHYEASASATGPVELILLLGCVLPLIQCLRDCASNERY